MSRGKKHCWKAPYESACHYILSASSFFSSFEGSFFFRGLFPTFFIFYFEKHVSVFFNKTSFTGNLLLIFIHSHFSQSIFRDFTAFKINFLRTNFLRLLSALLIVFLPSFLINLCTTQALTIHQRWVLIRNSTKWLPLDWVLFTLSYQFLFSAFL